MLKQCHMRGSVAPQNDSSQPALQTQIFRRQQPTSAWRLLFQQPSPFPKPASLPPPQLVGGALKPRCLPTWWFLSTISLFTPVTCRWLLCGSRCLFFAGLNPPTVTDLTQNSPVSACRHSFTHRRHSDLIPASSIPPEVEYFSEPFRNPHGGSVPWIQNSEAE